MSLLRFTWILVWGTLNTMCASDNQSIQVTPSEPIEVDAGDLLDVTGILVAPLTLAPQTDVNQESESLVLSITTQYFTGRLIKWSDYSWLIRYIGFKKYERLLWLDQQRQFRQALSSENAPSLWFDEAAYISLAPIDPRKLVAQIVQERPTIEKILQSFEEQNGQGYLEAEQALQENPRLLRLLSRLNAWLYRTTGVKHLLFNGVAGSTGGPLSYHLIVFHLKENKIIYRSKAVESAPNSSPPDIRIGNLVQSVIRNI